MANEHEGNKQRGSSNQQNQQTERKEPASPKAISAAAVEIAERLSSFTPTEQWRVIKAAATINGIEPTNAQRQQQRRG